MLAQCIRIFATRETSLTATPPPAAPPASPCYPPSEPSGNCDDVQRLWTDPSWRANQSDAMQSTNFETFIFKNGTISACSIDTSLGVPCERGNVPAVGMDARSDTDIQAAVVFAAARNFRVVVRKTGHDFFGRSTARGSFVIWTHNLKNVTFHDRFAPAGAPRSVTHDNVITLGAGVQRQEAYEAANARNQVLVSGSSFGGTTGAAGGWILGGGRSILSPTFGPGVDNILQFTMISSTGKRFVANAHQNPDLFFALRGGGGGTYGVVTSVTTHPNLPLIGAIFSATTDSTTPSSSLNSLLTELVKLTLNLSDAGWGGCFSVMPDPATGNLGPVGYYVLFNGSAADANRSIDPFFSFARALASDNAGGLTIQSAFTTLFDSFLTWFMTFFPKANIGAGTNSVYGSWLLPRDVI